MFPADVEQQGPLLLREVLGEALIAAGLRPETVEAVRAESVEPALERGDRVGARARRTRRSEALLAQGAQLGGELAVGEYAMHEWADDRGAIDRHGLGGVGGAEIHSKGSFLRLLGAGPLSGIAEVCGMDPGRWALGLGLRWSAALTPRARRRGRRDARSRASRLVGAALAASAAAALAATRRNDAEGPAPGTDGNSSPRATARAQRRNVTQPLAAVAPRTLAGHTRCRTLAAVVTTSPQSASAKPIAEALYSRPATTSNGTTTITAPQGTQRYRRTVISTVSGGSNRPPGPRTCRTRVPWP